MATLRTTTVVDKRLHSGVQKGPQQLNGLDLFNGHVGIPIALAYPQGIDLARAEEALVRTLAQYPLVTGRFRKDAQGHAYVDCNDAGMSFQVLACEGPMPRFGVDSPMGKGIKQFYQELMPWHWFGKDRPLLQVRVHQFADGGVVVCCYGPHSLFDGSAYWQLMQDWSSACQGLALPERPFERAAMRAIVSGEHGLQDTDLVYDPPMRKRIAMFASLGWQAVWHMRKEVIRVPAATVQRWREAAKQEGAEVANVSPVELVAAHCMKVISPLLPDGVDRSVGLVLDMRHRRRLRLPRDFFGNALCYGEVHYTPQELATQSLASVALRCRPAAHQIDTPALLRLLALMERYRLAKAVWKLFLKPAGESTKAGMLLNNCVNFPMYDIDLGRGKPSWFDICPVLFRMLMVVPTPEQDGGMDLHFTARKAELDAVRQSLR
jgi:shikimate O-hydroxycinnamoyltransferase